MNTKIERLSGTIAAQSSAQGTSGVAVIRVSGSGVKTIIKKAINKEVDYPDSIKNIFENEEKFTILDNNIMDIKNYILNNIE